MDFSRFSSQVVGIKIRQFFPVQYVSYLYTTYILPCMGVNMIPIPGTMKEILKNCAHIVGHLKIWKKGEMMW